MFGIFDRPPQFIVENHGVRPMAVIVAYRLPYDATNRKDRELVVSLASSNNDARAQLLLLQPNAEQITIRKTIFGK